MILTCFATIASAQVASAVRSAHPAFNKATDILIAQFDNKPDPDDIHSQAALGCMLKHSDLQNVKVYAVQGAYGQQGGVYLDSSGLFNLIYGPEGANTWTDAHKNWTTSVTRIVNKVKPILQSGGHVWVQEAGQSNITADWIYALINQEGIPTATTKNNITVVQHSTWNEGQTAAADLNYVKANATYVKIADGNSGGNGTPDFNLSDATYLNEVRNGLANDDAEARWLLADQIIEDYSSITSYNNGSIINGGVDFSDCVENWWILNVGTDADTVRKFWDRFVVNDAPNANINPTVSFSLPASDLVISVGASVTVEANAYDSDGTISRVELFINDSFIRSEAVAPYVWGTQDAALVNMATGSYTLKLVAYDNLGSASSVVYRSVIVGQSSGTATVQINAIDYDVESHPTDDNKIRKGTPSVGYITNGTWVAYNNIDLGGGVTSLSIEAASATSGGTVQFRLGSPTGTVIGSVVVGNTGGWNNYRSYTTSAVQSVSGAQDLYVVFVGASTGYLLNLKTITFELETEVISPDLGVLFTAVSYNSESHPSDLNLVRNMTSKVGYIKNGTWIAFESFDFGSGVSSFTVNAASTTAAAKTIQLRLGSPTGTLIGSVAVNNTGGWDTFAPFSTTALQPVSGVQNLYLVFVSSSTGYLYDLQSFIFQP